MQNSWHWRPERCVNRTLWNGMYRFKKNSVRVLDILFSYNKKIENGEKFINLIKKIENVLKIWRIRKFTIQGKITIFKIISKVIHVAFVTNVPQVIIDQLNKIQNDFV